MNLSPFFKILNIVKMLHWASKSYAQHMALDECYNDLNDKIDQFIEAYIGKFISNDIKSSEISLPKIDMNGDINYQISILVNEFFTEIAKYAKGSDLESLIDDMENIFNKLRYLLRLK